METTTNRVNGIDVDALEQLVERVKEDSAAGIARFGVTSRWLGGTRTDAKVDGWGLGGQRLEKDFTISIDEPEQLLGANQYANPQEYLLAAVNACMMATYVAACSAQGIELESLEFRTEGDLDLRGFLAIDSRVPSGYESVSYTIRVRGNATPEQFADIHEHMKQTSPNYFNMVRAVAMNATLEVL